MFCHFNFRLKDWRRPLFSKEISVSKYKLADSFIFRNVTAIDIDDDALAICKQNIEEFEMKNIEVEQHDVTDLGSEVIERLKGNVDTVIMNPPFGTKYNAGIQFQCLYMLKICFILV